MKERVDVPEIRVFVDVDCESRSAAGQNTREVSQCSVKKIISGGEQMHAGGVGPRAGKARGG